MQFSAAGVDHVTRPNLVHTPSDAVYLAGRITEARPLASVCRGIPLESHQAVGVGGRRCALRGSDNQQHEDPGA